MALRRRENLKPYLNRWGIFSAHVASLSAHEGQPTILLTQVYDSEGEFMAQHVWVKGCLYGACVGDNIVFRGHVSSYTKGVRRQRTINKQRQYDYHIDRIQQVRKVERV